MLFQEIQIIHYTHEEDKANLDIEENRSFLKIKQKILFFEYE